ncbi:hypothetical protein [Candidatus Mycoplasma haematohominis]|uniref:hypothetical protein n=1 Tax=Candidatus Mycoplasma haematohominis TaxID=1494318 RepID=UPI001C0A73DB|nr:hypothetical protein [Candidatus Mycoplasma haemohominis]
MAILRGGDGNPGSPPATSQEPDAAPQPKAKQSPEAPGDSQEEGKSNPEQESQNSVAEQTDSQAASHQTQSSSASESNAKDPCEDMTGLINTINKQNSDFSNIAQLIRNASTLKQCIEKQGEAQAQS